jgi:DNA-binding transcriptional LysR family regulator
VQCGGFKQAALEVHRTQPAISLAIRKLEEELEVDPFDWSSYRPALTEHGKAFYERSLKILSGMSELEGLAKSFRSQEEPEVKLAIDGLSPLPKLMKIFKKFSDRYPNTKLN